MYCLPGKRSALAIALMLWVSLLMSACGGGASETATDGNNPSSTELKAQGGTEKKTVKVLLAIGVSGEEEYYQEQAKIFNEKNPDIDLQIVFVPEYGNTVQLAFASDDAPDIIRMNGSLPTKMTISYSKGWIQPLDPFITDAFKNKFPPGSFGKNSGTIIDGKIYGVPFAENKEPALRPLYYNIDILNQFGYEEPPKTWSELKEMAARITKEGQGRVYGFSINGKEGIHVPVISLYETANGRYQDGHLTEGNIIYDARTGKSAANNPPLNAAIQLIKEMAAENIFIPGWESVDGRTLYQQFASGKTAMMIGQFWYAKEIMALNPNMNLGITHAPVPDSGRQGYKGVYSLTEPYFGITSSSKHPEAAWRVIEFFSTLEFHEGWHEVTKLPTVLWRDYKNIDPYTEQLLNVAMQDLRVVPYPGYMHPDGEKLMSAIMANAPKPDVKELINMAIVGNKDFEQLAREYDQKVDQLIDKQINELRSAGSNITRDVLIAPEDWNPMEDYITE